MQSLLLGVILKDVIETSCLIAYLMSETVPFIYHIIESEKYVCFTRISIRKTCFNYASVLYLFATSAISW